MYLWVEDVEEKIDISDEFFETSGCKKRIMSSSNIIYRSYTIYVHEGDNIPAKNVFFEPQSCKKGEFSDRGADGPRLSPRTFYFCFEGNEKYWRFELGF